MRLLYLDKKNKFAIWKAKRIVWFVSEDTSKTAHLDSELSMKRFKDEINNWINKRNNKNDESKYSRFV